MGWQWYQLDHMQTTCTSIQRDNHASTSSLNFLQARCSSWCPTNSVKALKALTHNFCSTAADKQTDRQTTMPTKVIKLTTLQSVIMVSLSTMTGLHWTPASTLHGTCGDSRSVCDSWHTVTNPPLDVGSCPAPGLNDMCPNRAHRAEFSSAASAPANNNNTKIVLRPFVWDYPGESVPEETLTHPPSWSSFNLYQLLPFTTMHSILPVQIACSAPANTQKLHERSHTSDVKTGFFP